MTTSQIQHNKHENETRQQEDDEAKSEHEPKKIPKFIDLCLIHIYTYAGLLDVCIHKI